ncbi:MAG TPA: GNAT family N-acetyltransferase [Roseiarcus sp.]|jgi:putative acetyltransferase
MADKAFPAEALTIRLRDRRDDDALLELFNQERFLRYASARGPFASSDDLQGWLANIACSNRVEVVAAIGDKTIGFGALYVMGDGLSHSGWILLGVHEEFQAQGVGAKLLQMLMAIASVTIGLRRVQLTVFADNEPAIKLYRRFGFEIEGRHRDFVRRGEGFVDAFTMAIVYRGAQAAALQIVDPQLSGRRLPAATAEIRPH